MNTVVLADGPERAQRHGCVCVLLITEDGGTQRGTRARCLSCKRIAKENYLGD